MGPDPVTGQKQEILLALRLLEGHDACCVGDNAIHRHGAIPKTATHGQARVVTTPSKNPRTPIHLHRAPVRLYVFLLQGVIWGVVVGLE
eukprot:CAMPEP_0204445066 /NCGR_PEP_ID=MMETSP0470-20130426/92188_1 /ASSEMBLY_ACC=CAM_ASM_000385 /TAXON_ID=2969 /ORGANISM="Oxyrrhis marina" /LENGTH=88 /DNA_ID=CAMNT_0051444495 /DNA_START=141 /DNA_END=407 /DNA_ORIENTATION=-